MDKDQIYKQHILDSIGYIEEFAENKTFDDFVSSRRLQNELIRELEIIGEAVKRLSADFKQNANEIPWTKIASMRDRLIHDYFKVDYQIVWDTIQIDLPRLKSALEK